MYLIKTNTPYNKNIVHLADGAQIEDVRNK